MNYPEPERFCWLCGEPVDGKFFDMHYAGEHYVYFCSLDHWCTHRKIKDL